MKKEIRIVREILASLPDDSNKSLEEQRNGMNELMAAMPPPEGTLIEAVEADGIPAEWVSFDGAAKNRVIYYLHGGGYVMGSPATHRRMVALIGRAAGAAVLSLDYRLAPEHPYPAAVEDATAGYRWLLRQDIHPGGIAIAGDSAGGGLAAATLVSLRDAGDPLPACGVFISPWADMTCSSETYDTERETDPFVVQNVIKEMADCYLNGANPKTPLASPVFADLAELPPLLIQVGSEEVLLGDALALEGRARAAGVDCTLEVWPDMIHVWHFFSEMLLDARKAINRVGEFCKIHQNP
ncbi:MAG: hypothetical protein AVO39_11610 [delta proteobacterium MLS_D]|nr:MAG: hypothetical protein AVO39_11610 [delta proteobacterium MLS_D]